MRIYTSYSVVIAGETSGIFQDLASAIRCWDREAKGATGHISVLTTDEDGRIIRDGHILHVTHDQVYLNPNLVDA